MNKINKTLISILIISIIGMVSAMPEDLPNPIFHPTNNSELPTINASDYWITAIGSLRTVLPSQFNNIAGTLTIDESWISSLWCKLTGCIMTGDLTFSNAAIQNPNYIQFNTSWEDGQSEGRLQWSIEDGTLEFGMPGGDINLPIGQASIFKATNVYGETILAGQPVVIFSASGNNIEITLVNNSIPELARKTIGLVVEDILDNQKGYVVTNGFERNIDTSIWSEGDPVFVGEADGELTNINPPAPQNKVRVGFVTRSHATEGSIYVIIDKSLPLYGLNDVNFTDAPHGSVLVRDKVNGVWNTNLNINLTGNNITADYITTSGITLDRNLGGCIIMRDTDDAGWTRCTTLNGALNCIIDSDGVC